MIEELEHEMEYPENWVEDIILIKDGRGQAIEVDVPDDQEEE